MHPFILVLILVIAGLVFWSWSSRQAQSGQSGAPIPWSRFAGVLIMIALAVIALRFSWLAAAGVPLVVLVQRLLAQQQRQRATQGPTPGGESQVQTRYLRVRLDHDSGEMDGEVRTGRFAGSTLNDLSCASVIELLTECQREDTDSVSLIEAYLDRRFGEQWRDEPAAAANEPGASMDGSHLTRAEALAILGLENDASDADIIAAHRRLINKLHPDRGGSTYLAARINQAKEYLLH